jgi:hypothetical protein
VHYCIVLLPGLLLQQAPLFENGVAPWPRAEMPRTMTRQFPSGFLALTISAIARQMQVSSGSLNAPLLA